MRQYASAGCVAGCDAPVASALGRARTRARSHNVNAIHVKLTRALPSVSNATLALIHQLSQGRDSFRRPLDPPLFPSKHSLGLLPARLFENLLFSNS
jgi:hypothetical protein